MHRAGYNLVASRHSRHRQLTEEVLKKKATFEKGEIIPATETSKFLQNWLIDHIQTEGRADAADALSPAEATQKLATTR
jgi:hemerythrin